MEYLHGGRQNQISRSGKVVYRPAGRWSKSVHLLLEHVRDNGFCAVPEPLGFDGQGNEILTYLPGEVSNYPLSQAAASLEALETAAGLLRRYHDATASFLDSGTGDLQWMLPPVEPAEVICHGDYAPYNVVLDGCTAVAIIDFDTAHPGPRVWDVAYALYRWAPLKNPANPDSLGDLESQIQRARRFCDLYGLSEADRRNIVDVAVRRLGTLLDFMHAQAAQGSETFLSHLADGHHLSYLNDMKYMQRYWKRIVQGLVHPSKPMG